MMYGALPAIGAFGAGGAGVLLSRRSDSGFQALAGVVAVTTLIMAGTSVAKLLPPRRGRGPDVAWRQPRPHHAVPERTAWVAVP
ncbi:hypothetical protein [Streptomyces clavuligerus]|uniref:Uncharacterized protein n=1 Tax=Streptomyces clavuligerus TaxID=1901 RepID=E2Q0J5_STRCL|nr:hypothetical protein [Streptomyces clavuligerus]ANW21747.1 hypothetical protein BB341_01180 [Streptomyces clavuligerus]AXU16380.1 hypothetical protein D1794_01255 [Streptomyces clavuligerus]EFG10538.1 Hypothetical protein SCLAV_5471 [Streptomyces clavuligerus]MBY6301284.1 hypothetical protein [Streptomyces clavuligerus]QCS09162.1 hypothetical protein CRV15_01255 [Streptomyces clavuligerus]